MYYVPSRLVEGFTLHTAQLISTILFLTQRVYRSHSMIELTMIVNIVYNRANYTNPLQSFREI